MTNKYMKKHSTYHLLREHKLKPQKDITIYLLEYRKQKRLTIQSIGERMKALQLS